MPPYLNSWHEAVLDGDLLRVAELLRKHPELKSHVNDPIFSFNSPALFHCRDNLALVDLLIEHGADLNQKSKWWAGGFGILEGVSSEVAQPLIQRGAPVDIWAASGLNDLERVAELLDQSPHDVTSRGGDGKHPLHYAASVPMVDLLLDRGADVNAKCIDHESTAAHYLVQNRDVVLRLVQRGARPDVFMASVLGDETLLRQSLVDAPDCCNWRIGNSPWTNRAGGHIYNWTIGHDQTPQQVARNAGHTSILRLLLENASPVTRLMDALWSDDQQQIQSMVQQSPDPLAQLSHDDLKSLARAAWWYNPAGVKNMLELGFDPHVPGVHDSTPLDRASFHGYADIVELLLTYDPSPPIHRKNEFGGTPLEACLHGTRHGWETGNPQDHVETVRLLVEAGSKVTSDHLGRSNEPIDRILQSSLS